MTPFGRRPVRVLDTRAGRYYVVQTPFLRCPIPGWLAYRVQAVRAGDDTRVELTLYERTDEGPPRTDEPQRAA